MASAGRGKVYEFGGGKLYVYIPARVRDDSQFTFSPGEHVLVRIEADGQLVISKIAQETKAKRPK